MKKTSRTPIWKSEICDHCAYSSWVTSPQWKLDCEGNPITLRCPNYCEGKCGIVRGTKACWKFKSK